MKARKKFWLGGKRKPEQDLFFKRTLESLGWIPGDAQDWDACWFTGMPKPAEFRAAGPDRKINHIPGNGALTIKSRLYDTVSAMRDRVSEQFGPGHKAVSRLQFLPTVYSMPQDYHLLQQAALDDPGQRWILKPKNASRGRGISVVSDIASVPMDSSWLVQQYVANPHTMHQRKYVLRLYVLVSSIEPLRIHLHQQGFAKLASAPYDVNDVDNPYSQLTNPDINALNDDAEVPVEFVDLERYREWLRNQGHDDELLFERIRDLVTLTVISAVESLRAQTRACGADSRGCYELLGIDCLVDDQLKPWILECNLSPSLGVCTGPDGGAQIEERVKAEVVADMISLVGLDVSDTGTGTLADRIGFDARQEHARAGRFERLWPNQHPENYLPYFALPRLADMVLVDDVKGAPAARPQLLRRHAHDLIHEDRLALYDERDGRLEWLNETASLIWLMAMQGADPDTIARQLQQTVAASEHGARPDLWTIRNDVWDCLADWAQAGRLMQGKGAAAEDAGRLVRLQQEIRGNAVPKPPPFRISVACGALHLDIHTDSQPLAARLEAALSVLAVERADPASSQLQVVRDTPGYTLVLDGEVTASKLTLAAVVPAIADCMLRRAPAKDEVILDSIVVDGGSAGAGTMIVARGQSVQGDAFALRFAEHRGNGLSRGLRLNACRPDRATSLGLPLQCNAKLIAASTSGLSEPLAVEALIIPRVKSAPSENIIRMASVDEALGALLSSCIIEGGPMDARGLVAFMGWLGRRTLYSLDVSDPTTAVKILQRHLNEPHLACAPAHSESIPERQESTA